VQLVRDLLDKPVADRNRREMGRVDGIVLEVSPHEPPRVIAIEIGPSVLGHRIHPALGRIIATVEDVSGVGSGRPTRINVAEISRVGETIRVGLTVSERGAYNVENAVRAFWRHR
jgi:hypothetical protein